MQIRGVPFLAPIRYVNSRGESKPLLRPRLDPIPWRPRPRSAAARPPSLRPRGGGDGDAEVGLADQAASEELAIGDQADSGELADQAASDGAANQDGTANQDTGPITEAERICLKTDVLDNYLDKEEQGQAATAKPRPPGTPPPPHLLAKQEVKKDGAAVTDQAATGELADQAASDGNQDVLADQAAKGLADQAATDRPEAPWGACGVLSDQAAEELGYESVSAGLDRDGSTTENDQSEDHRSKRRRDLDERMSDLRKTARRLHEHRDLLRSRRSGGGPSA